MDRKKRVEAHYLEEARRASSIFPCGEAVPNEPLDFLLPGAAGTLGIEMTELCRQLERHEGARLGYVAPKAKRFYNKRPDTKPVSVSPAFSHHADGMSVDELAISLADFVYEHRDGGSFSWNQPEGLPKGYCHIGVFEPVEWEHEGEWRYFRAFATTLAPKELLEARIAEKNLRLGEYRKIASEVWLLMINDLFIGPGEVCLRLGDLAQWTFDFAFDKVLLFERQPGGSGKVIELRRRLISEVVHPYPLQGAAR